MYSGKNVVTLLLILVHRSSAFLARLPDVNVGGRGFNRLSATLVREQGVQPPGGRTSELLSQQQQQQQRQEPFGGTSVGNLGGSQLSGRQEVDVENWFWGQQPDQGLQSVLFANDDRALVLFDGVCRYEGL
jgi:hypothetical protein